ncbi:MAG: phage holin family protein [Enterococcus sp.]
MGYFQRLLVNTLTFISITVIFPDLFHVSSILTAVLASFVLSILNGFIKPILVIFSFPLTILTLGLFSFVINGAMLSLTSYLVGETAFGFSSFGSAILVAAIMAIVNLVVTDHNFNQKDLRHK